MKVDQFESVFRAADKVPYRFEGVSFRKVLVVSDLDEDGAREFCEQAKSFLGELGRDGDWESWRAKRGTGAEVLMRVVEEGQPDLVYTYRSLASESYRWLHTLGEHLDVLTQTASCPVLVVPHPRTERASVHALTDLDHVMAMTDHLAGDHRLVNHAVAFTETDGTLLLCHIEDDATFERYMSAVSRVPAIDTDLARQEILRQLLKEARDYIASCREVIGHETRPMEVAGIVTLGHRLEECRRIIAEHEVDLLVVNTKDADQLAMHGLAYPLAVELRQIPLLLL